MLMHGYWQEVRQRSVGHRPPITLDGKPHEIIGVLPAELPLPEPNPQLVLPMRLNRAELFVGNFSYQGLARLKPGVTLAQANADVTRMIPLVDGSLPDAAGLHQGDVQRGADRRQRAAAVAGRDRRRRPRALGRSSARSASSCSSRARTSPTCSWSARKARSRNWRSMPRSAPARGASRWELLSESLMLGAARRRGGAAARRRPASARSSRWRRPACRASRTSASIRVVLLFTLAISMLAGLLFGLIPVAQVRDAAAGVARSTRAAALGTASRAAPSRAQHTGRRRDRAGRRPAGRLGPDDPHVPGDARTSIPGFTQPGAGDVDARSRFPRR